jgi:uncharacterized protein YegL
MTEPRGHLLPIYFVADESSSMTDHVGELNAGLSSLLDALHGESMAAAKVRFAVLGFSDTALCHLPLSDLREIGAMPALAARSNTSYHSAFERLRNEIPSDVANLKRAGYLVHRPAVFFLTDGYPDASESSLWRADLDKLKAASFAERPNILAFGIGQADPAIIIEVASKPEFAFQAAAGTDLGVAIGRFFKALTQSVVSSGQALADGFSELQGERPEGFKMAVDLI